MEAQCRCPLGVSALLANGVTDAETGAIVGRHNRDLRVTGSEVVQRILYERASLFLKTRGQVEGEALRLDRTSAIGRERSDHRQGGAFRELDERDVLPGDERRNDGEDLRLTHQLPKRIDRGAR